MKQKIIIMLGEIRQELLTTTVLSFGLFMTGILYGIYNIPAYQDINQIDLIVEQTKLSIPPAFIASAFIVFVTRLLNLVAKPRKLSNEARLLLDLQEKIDNLIKENDELRRQIKERNGDYMDNHIIIV